MPSLTVELNPNTTYKIRLEAGGYKTLEFDYTTGTTATTVTKTLVPVIAPRPPPCDSYGDVDNDGYVSKTDLEIVQQYLVGGWGNVKEKTPLTEDEFKRRADVNGNGVVDISDAAAIDSYASGVISTFPVCGTVKYECKIELWGKTLLDKHEVAPNEAVSAAIYIRNTGEVPTDAFMRCYLDGVKKADITKYNIGVGARQSGGCPLKSPTPGTHTVKVEVGPSGKSVTDTKIDTFTVVGAVTTGTLSVSTTPTGASVTIGTETKISPCTFTLTAGTHTITITKTGYETITASAWITEGKTTYKSYTLVKKTVNVTFSANAPAKLFVDGILKGTLS